MVLVKNFGFAVRACLEVALIKIVDTHESILSSRGVARPSRVYCDPSFSKNQPRRRDILECLVDVRVQRAKVALDTAYLLFENTMPKTRFEFSLSQRCRRDAHRLLPTPQKHLHTSS